MLRSGHGGATIFSPRRCLLSCRRTEILLRIHVFTRFYFFVLCAFLVSCGTRSQMVDMWVDPDFPPGPMKKMFILALIEGQAGREAWEGAFARVLEKNDVVVVPSQGVLLSAMPDSASVFDAARLAGCDGVLVVYETYEHHETETVPGYIKREEIRQPERIKHVTFAYPAYERVRVVETYIPPHEKIQTAIHCDVEVWSTLDEDVRMVWSGTTEVIEPNSDQSICTIVAGWVEYQLMVCGLVPAGL